MATKQTHFTPGFSLTFLSICIDSNLPCIVDVVRHIWEVHCCPLTTYISYQYFTSM